MKGIGASAAGAVALGSDYGMVDDAEAIVPLVLGAAAGGAAVGWALREFNVIGSDSPPEGLSADSLKNQAYQTARTRKSTNASTFIDNQNIVASGLENTLYTKGKVAAIEALNDQKSQSAVESAALEAMQAHATTVEKNFLKSWEESLSEFEALHNSLASHSGTNPQNVIAPTSGNGTAKNFAGTPTKTITLADGTSFDIRWIKYGTDAYLSWGPTGRSDSFGFELQAYDPDDGSEAFTYMAYEDWNPVWSDLQTAITNVNDGLLTWVSTAYSEVQSGAIEIADLQTPQTRANMMAEEGAQAQAIADLQALNVPLDVGREVTVALSSTGAKLRGTLGLTKPDGITLEAGTTYDPASWSGGDAYLTYNVAEGSGSWSAYNEGVDGGIATVTSEPYQQTQYEFTTSNNETAVVNRSDFIPVNSSGAEVSPDQATAWEVDLSSKLENDITTLTGVDFFADVEESRYVTIPLQEQFTLEAITNRETGEKATSMTFETTEPQTDSNYITQEEWDAMEAKNQELIDKYEQSLNTGGGGIDLGGLDMFGIPGEIIALLVAGAGALLYGNSN